VPRPATRTLALSLVLLAGVPATATAEWQLAPFIGQTFGSNTTIPDPEGATDRAHRHYGGSVMLVGDGLLGVEGLFLITPSFFQRPSSVPGLAQSPSSYQMALMGNVVLATPRRWNEYGLRPFVSGGGGLLRIISEDQGNVIDVRLNALGYNVGGGAVGFLTNRVGLRFDVRYFRMQPTELPGFAVGDLDATLSFWTFSVGVAIRP
jgi:hypothetical protein